MPTVDPIGEEALEDHVEATETEQERADVGKEVVPAWFLSSFVGAGTLLGGSMWLALRRHRAAQRRHRRPGRMIAVPAPNLAPVERTLNRVGPAAAPRVEFIDRALRGLAAQQARDGRPMPALVTVEQSEATLTLHLECTK